MLKNKQVTPIILAGGKSRRMGTNKSFVLVDGQPMIEVILQKIRPIFNQTPIVVTNSPGLYAALEIRTVEDIIKDQGPLGGIHAGLKASDTEFNFIFGCDMPFLQPTLIKYMMEKIGQGDLIIPHYGDCVEPLHAIYSKSCLAPIEEQLGMGSLKIQSFFSAVKIYYIEKEEIVQFSPNLDCFSNINTPKDLANSKSLGQEEGLKRMREGVTQRKINRLSQDGTHDFQDFIVREFPLTIFLNGEELVTLLCTPENMKALVLGFLHGEGIIKNQQDIASWRLDEEKGLAEVKTAKNDTLAQKLYKKRIIPTGCGKGSVFVSAVDALECKKINSAITIQEESIYRILKELLHSSEIFQMTGAVHTVALCSQEKILVLQEDVARHNAVDKVVGYCLLNDISPKDKIIMVTGRISSEMLSKVAKLEIPILISKSAPTSLAIDMAEKLGITLVGFVRGKRMNIYTHGQRITRSF